MKPDDAFRKAEIGLRGKLAEIEQQIINKESELQAIDKMVASYKAALRDALASLG